MLVKGSRRVAAGEFGYRIALDTQRRNVGELADAMNDMTARFEAIRDDLDRQVRERTKQVVRSEQLASVGFLAAGVAHEINNPLASIALCAESLEGRVDEVLDAAPTMADADRDVHPQLPADDPGTRPFAARESPSGCSTSRAWATSPGRRTDLRELVQGVIDMVGHLGRYQDKQHRARRRRAGRSPPVNAQEMKQVVLNLITNGLDSLVAGRTARRSSSAHARRHGRDRRSPTTAAA